MLRHLTLVISSAIIFQLVATAAQAREADQLALLKQPTPVLDLQPASIWDLPIADRYVLVAELEQ